MPGLNLHKSVHQRSWQMLTHVVITSASMSHMDLRHAESCRYSVANASAHQIKVLNSATEPHISGHTRWTPCDTSQAQWTAQTVKVQYKVTT